MKKINTNVYFENTEISLEEIKEIIQELPFDEHQYIVLFEDNSNNYIQTALENPELDEESRYLIETRIYKTPDKFNHYCTFVNTAQEVIAPFEAFYNNTAFSYDNWKDITAEFVEN
ncbi:MAG: hypothetical protein Q3983_01805 [Capnocytophaga sp.]|nr:hypothetical protein [Capnocytophaga sp.]